MWNDLTWEHVAPAGNFIEINGSFSLTDPTPFPLLEEKIKQYGDDKQVSWNPNTNAAELAYIFFQVPIMVAVHASEMLRRK